MALNTWGAIAIPSAVCSHCLAKRPLVFRGVSSHARFGVSSSALKKVAHHPDGVLWPRQQPGGCEALPVVLLEVQMHADRRFHRRLGAETFRLLQQHEEVAHLQVLVLLAHRRLTLGSSQPLLLRRFLQEDVTWVDLAALARQPDLDPMLALLTLPVINEPDLGPCAHAASGCIYSCGEACGYGSLARGDWDGFSDIDLLVVAANQDAAERVADQLIEALVGDDVLAIDH